MNPRKSIGRRRSGSLAGFASKDLCKTIAKSPPPPERLLTLLERVFQYSMSTVQTDMRFTEDLESFKMNSVNCWEKAKAAIIEQNLCENAFAEKEINTSDPDITCIEDKKVILEAESRKWDGQISQAREDMSKEIDKKYTIKVSDYPEKDMLYDYSDLIKQSSSSYEALQNQLGDLKRHTRAAKKCLKLRSNAKIQTICKKYFDQKNAETPRTLIKKINSANKVKKHYRYS